MFFSFKCYSKKNTFKMSWLQVQCNYTTEKQIICSYDQLYNISHLASFLSIYYKGSRHALMKTKGRLQCLMRWGWSSLVFQLVQEPQFVFCCPIMSSSDGFFIFYQHHYLSLPAGLIISQTTGP